MSVASNTQRRLKFILKKTLGDARVDVRVELTGSTNRFTVMSINGHGAAWTAQNIAPGKEASHNSISDAGMRFPFQPGKEYTTTQITDFCTSDYWNCVMTDKDGNNTTVSLESKLVAPTGLGHGTMTNTTAPLTWTNPNTGSLGTEADFQEIWFRTGAAAFAKFATLPSGSAVSGTVTGLTTGTSYDFKIRAVNYLGNGAFSSVHTVSTT